MAHNKGYNGKIQKLSIRRQFLKSKQSSFDSKWNVFFKLKDRVNDNQVKDMERMEINSESQRAGLRQCLKTNTPSHIRKPSLGNALEAMKTEIHIAKIKSHPTGKVRNCF